MRLLRVAAVTLAVLAGTAGCTTIEESAPTSTPPASTSTPSPTTAPKPKPTALPTRPAGSEGLTVRYRDDDGQVRTVRVEDFPR